MNIRPDDMPNLPATLVEVLRWRAATHPQRQVYAFLTDGETETQQLTYGELDQRARALAAELHDHGATGERVLLIFPPGLDFLIALFGCMYAGATAVPIYPPHPARLDRSLPRLRLVVQRTTPRVLLATASIHAVIAAAAQQAPELSNLPWLSTSAYSATQAERWVERTLDPESLALIQHTSGSTAAPRGVMLTHRNLLHNLAVIQRGFATTPESCGVFWLPFYHDLGLIGGVMETVYCGGLSTFLSPVAFLQRPVRWLQAISSTRAQISGGPNFAYQLCAERVSDEQRVALDLSSWDLAFSGAEPVRYATLKRFAERFAPCGFRMAAFYPCYGLAESTLMVTGGQRAAPPTTIVPRDSAHDLRRLGDPLVLGERGLVSCGRPLLDQQVAIVDPHTRQRCDEGHIGEIWVAGPSVAQGYWGQPEVSAETFGAEIVGEPDGGGYLRTGDLGLLQGGELFVAGILKDLIIINGQNYYPQDIELTVEQAHPAIRAGCCAAFTAPLNGRERLVIVAELDHHAQPGAGGGASRRQLLDMAAMVRQIRHVVAANHALQVDDVRLLKAGTIPKTSSGKIQRHACRSGFLAGTLEVWGG